MHRFDQTSTRATIDAVLAYAADRLSLDPVPLDAPRSPEELAEAAGRTVTPEGLGAAKALEVFAEVLAPACLSVDHPRYLSFIPCAPTKEAAAFDVVVGASSIYGGSWLEGAGAVHAENEALRWIADLAGLPPQAGGVFVPGGTIGNLSALVAARHSARARAVAAGSDVRPWRVATTYGAHSSIQSACDVMDAELVTVPMDEHWRLSAAALRATLEEHGAQTFFAVVATSGTTNFGVVDDLAAVAEVCAEYGVWFHVDGAYGGAGLAAPSVRHLYDGIEQADSFIVDPHKWLFAPFDCCALLYRDPALARAAHTQKASYLDILTEAPEWNPTDYSVGLTRRARGLPLWYSLATHGTQAYTDAVERTLQVAAYAEEEIGRRPYLEVLRERDLSVVVFRRVGWTPADYAVWSQRLLDEQVAFVVPTSHEGETVTRIAVVNPETSEEDIRVVLNSMT
ncbi:pyridoxal phosphate-dependent decarboxylase family protein [Lapillicoccus jejuensis]|uniref:Glutamate/tyrosine decarboxylase-like PLP-dependent enzyme n=1 Tax=Lapillicoccus jejuensis TaxID=402171 RepID=A0A542E143_9MICO|nr:aminotransferase class V-fold PLP-dependent enzyme [Lapillicoccus jejuensis]TQJ08924.1 glutamate/tyrosine decarboxylase-like PLP-dependent enzyme [Lapillicoccus jejuensis]